MSSVAEVHFLALPFPRSANYGIAPSTPTDPNWADYVLNSTSLKVNVKIPTSGGNRISFRTEYDNLGLSNAALIKYSDSGHNAWDLYWLDEIVEVSSNSNVKQVTMSPDAVSWCLGQFKSIRLSCERRPTENRSLPMAAETDMRIPFFRKRLPHMSYDWVYLDPQDPDNPVEVHKEAAAIVITTNEIVPGTHKVLQYLEASQTWQYVDSAASYPADNTSGLYQYAVFVDATLPGTRIDGYVSGGNAEWQYPTIGEVTEQIVSIFGASVDDKSIVDISITNVPIREMTYQDRGNDHQFAAYCNGSYTLVTYDNRTYGFLELKQGGEVSAEPYEDIINSTMLSVYDKVKRYDILEITDVYGNVIQSLPYWVPLQSSWYLTCVVDISGINVRIVQKDLGIRIDIPQGHLPWVGSAWDTYQAESMNYDREMLRISIEQNKANTITNITQSLGGAGIAAAAGTGAGGPIAGLATAGVGIAGSYASHRIMEDSLRREQRAKERTTHDAPSTVYSPGYGIAYLFYMLQEDSLVVRISRPRTMTDNRFTAFIRYNGWPANGEIAEVTSTDSGYWQGSVKCYINNTGVIARPPPEILEECAERFLRGVIIATSPKKVTE